MSQRPSLAETILEVVVSEPEAEQSEWRFVFAPWYIERSYRLSLAKGERLRLDDREAFIKKLAAKRPTKRWRPSYRHHDGAV